MTTTETLAHLIEKAARRMSTCRTFEPDLCGGCAKRLDEARAALYAVADDLRAEGWDEGQVAGWDDARDEWLSSGVVNDLRQWSDTPNPYRTAAATEGER